MLRMIAYLVMMVFASVSGAVCLAVACAASLSLSARFARMGYCKPEDCIPPLWFALEERHCLLCGRMNAPGRALPETRRGQPRGNSRAQSRSSAQRAERQRVSAERYVPGCAVAYAVWRRRQHCRLRELPQSVFSPRTFPARALCARAITSCGFSRPAALLMHRKTRLPSGATVERPYETAVLHCEEVRHRRMPDGPAFAEYPIWLLMPAAMYVAILFTCG